MELLTFLVAAFIVTINKGFCTKHASISPNLVVYALYLISDAQSGLLSSLFTRLSADEWRDHVSLYV